MPNAPKTPTRAIRVPDELWSTAVAATKDNDTSVSELLREFLEWYLRAPGARLPKRPPSRRPL